MGVSNQDIEESKNNQENRSNSIIRVNDGLVQTTTLTIIYHLRVKKMLASPVTLKEIKNLPSRNQEGKT